MFSETTTCVARPSLTAIFHCFFMIGVQSFGGGLSAWIRREVIQKRHWMEDADFLSALAVSQIVPGPNPMNLTVFLGNTLRGAAGSVVALAGLMLFPVVLVLALGEVYFAEKSLPAFEAAISGLGAVAVGMNLANGIQLTRRNIRLRQMIVVGLVAIAAGGARISLLEILAVIVPVNILIEYRAAK